jgi:DNA polymerase III gamma/tau subunit
MKAATVKEIKTELNNRSQKELLELCMHLSKFKKENKELLTYLLYEASNETAFIENVKREIEYEFEQINKTNYYFIKKSVRKILRTIKKYIRYSKKKETEVELLIYFCAELIKMKPSIKNNTVLNNLYKRQIASIKKTIATLHEDLQYDYEIELDEIDSTN